MTVYLVGFVPSKTGYWIDKATLVTVDGVDMARLAHGTIIPLTDSHASRAEALNAVADRMEQNAKEVLAKAAEVRKEAANA